jgi:hypothetical protein
VRSRKFQEIWYNGTRNTKEKVISIKVKCPYLLINPKQTYIVYCASVGSAWYEVSENFLHQKPRYRPKKYFTQRLKCPSLLTDRNQPYNICSSCEESTQYAVSGNSLELQTRYQRIAFCSPNKMSFITYCSQPNLHCLQRIRYEFLGNSLQW